MIGQSNHEIQTKSRVNVANTDALLNNTNYPTQVNGPHVDLHAFEKKL